MHARDVQAMQETWIFNVFSQKKRGFLSSGQTGWYGSSESMGMHGYQLQRWLYTTCLNICSLPYRG
jgi:hypothetical protein